MSRAVRFDTDHRGTWDRYRALKKAERVTTVTVRHDGDVWIFDVGPSLSLARDVTDALVMSA